MNITRKVSIIAVTAVASCMLAVAVVPGAEAADSGTVTSSRSFPKVQVVRKDLLSESASTSVDNDTNWGGVESLNVPLTKSKAEKEAEAAKKKAAEEAKAAAEAQAKAEAEAQAQAESQAASRSEERDSLYDVVPDTNTAATAATSSDATTGTATTTPTSASGSAIASYATQFVGSPYVAGGNTPSGWDCSGFVQYVYAQFGISLPHYSGAQATAGTAVASIADAQPGDILANGTHAAIYIGNGLVVNALNPYQGTQITGLGVFSSGYSIRRIL